MPAIYLVPITDRGACNGLPPSLSSTGTLPGVYIVLKAFFLLLPQFCLKVISSIVGIIALVAC